MDFEVIQAPQSAPGLRDTLLRFFNSRRKQLQDWDAHPPVYLGLAIFFATVFELTLSFQLVQHEGIKKGFIATAILLSALLFFFQMLFVSAAKQMAELFHKKGKSIAAWTFLNVGLVPYLIFLPLAVCVYLAGANNAWLMILFLVLSLQVMSNWKEGIEVAFELSRIQGAVVIYLLSGIAVLLSALIAYATFIKVVSDFI